MPRLTEEKSRQLTEAVTLEEIREAILTCEPLKVPRYDGFNIKCIKHVWPITGEDFSKYILQFFETGHLPASSNTIRVILIPKRKGVVEISDFRPISMRGSIYKVIAKVLSRRLRGIMPDWIGET